MRARTFERTHAVEEQSFARSGGTLPLMNAQELQMAASGSLANTGVGADGFHPKVPLVLSKVGCRPQQPSFLARNGRFFSLGSWCRMR